MKFLKKQLSNIIFVVVIGLMLFTPVGFHVRVYASKLLSFSPSEIDAEEQLKLSNYNWQLVDIDRNAFNFESETDKVVLVNFWATWCPPCVAEMPSLQLLYNDYKDKVDFVFVAHDEKDKVLQFLKKKSHTFPVYFEQNKAPELLATESIPTTFIIDRDGNIVVKKIGAADWNSDKTRELLDSLLAH